MAEAQARPQADALAADRVAPTKPRGLTVVSTTATSVTVSWRRSSDRVGVAGYIVYRNGVRIGSTARTTTRYVASALKCGTSYQIAVQAYDLAGNRSARAVVLAATSSVRGHPAAQRAGQRRPDQCHLVEHHDLLGPVDRQHGSRRVRGAERRRAGGLHCIDALRAHSPSLRCDVHDRRSGARRSRSPLGSRQHPGHDCRLPRYVSAVPPSALVDLGEPDLRQRSLVRVHRRPRRGRVRRLSAAARRPARREQPPTPLGASRAEPAM